MDEKQGAREGKEPQGERLSDTARRRLVRIARLAVEAAVKGKRPTSFRLDDPQLTGKQGVFVTLKTHGRLRGCMGHFTSSDPLWMTVQEVAILSATQDARFWDMKLRPEELKDVNIEISVLSHLRRIANPLDIELGKHGIYIRRGGRAGCFLPQVATETGWGKEEFLSHCCTGKAGLPADAWKDPKTEVLVFTAEIINEAEMT